MDDLKEEALDNADDPNQENQSSDDEDWPTADGTPEDIGQTDEELAEIVDSLSTSITVVGCGGGGCNTVNRMYDEGIDGCDLIALNTDAQHLMNIEADNKLLIGKNKTKGRGAGSLPKVGEESARENEKEIKEIVDGEDMVFVTAGMGGGTGTGAAPVVAKEAKDAGALTISVVTLPFSTEGEVRWTNAEAGLERLRQVSDTVITIPNDKLLETVGDLPTREAFKVCDEVLMRSVKGITQLITTNGLVNLDFSDVQTIMENGGVAMIGLGESKSTDRSEDVVKSAVSSPLLDVDISSADSVLVNVTGGPEMAIEEAEGVVEHLHDRVDPAARIIWGTGVDEEIEDTIRALVVVTGVESDQIFDENSSVNTESQRRDRDQSLGNEEDESQDDSDIDYVA